MVGFLVEGKIPCEPTHLSVHPEGGEHPWHRDKSLVSAQQWHQGTESPLHPLPPRCHGTSVTQRLQRDPAPTTASAHLPNPLGLQLRALQEIFRGMEEF